MSTGRTLPGDEGPRAEAMPVNSVLILETRF